MKKLTVAVVLAVASASVLALAGGVGANGGGQLIRTGFTCKILDGNGNQLRASTSELWLYQTKLVLRCSGDGPATTLTYFTGGRGTRDCKAQSGFQGGSSRTKDRVDKVGYNGNSQLTCTFPVPAASNTVADDGSDDGLVFDGA